MTVSLYRSKFIKLSTESASSPHLSKVVFHHFMMSEAFDTTPENRSEITNCFSRSYPLTNLSNLKLESFM